MPKKFENTKCIYCLKYFDELTSDHFFPQCFHLPGSPQELKQLQVPSCFECNQKFSKLEDELSVSMGLCINPNDPKFALIGKKAIRSVNRNCGKNDRDKDIRYGRMKKLASSTIRGDLVPSESVLPVFSYSPKLGKEKQIGVPIYVDALNALGEKLIRGVMYCFNENRYIDDKHIITVITDRHPENISSMIKSSGKYHDMQPSLSLGYAVVHNDKQCGLFEFEIWEKLRIFGIVDEKGVCNQKEGGSK